MDDFGAPTFLFGGLFFYLPTWTDINQSETWLDCYTNVRVASSLLLRIA